MYSTLNTKLLSSLALAALMTTVAGTARADTASEIRLLKAQLRMLERKVSEQDRTVKRTNAAVARVAVAGGGAAGPFTKGPLPVLLSCPGGVVAYKGICITPGGYLDFGTIYRTKNVEADLATPFASIPFGNNRIGRSDETRFSARASRLALKAQGDVNPVTHLTGYVEVDFQGAAQTANSNGTNSYNPRLRQAWVAIDRDDLGLHVAGGQTWSLATMFAKGLVLGKENIPITIDQQYLPGFTYTRQPQIRITKDLGPFTVGFSVENPATTTSGTVPTGTNAIAATTVNANCGGFNNGTVTSAGDANFNTCNSLSINRVPDFVGKAAVDPTFFGRTIHVEGYGLLRDFYDRVGPTANSNLAGAPATTTQINSTSRDVFGGGVGGSILVPILPKFVEVQFSALVGQGIGRYGTSGLSDTTFGPDGRLKPIQENQLLAGITIHPTDYIDLFAYAGQEEAARTLVNNGANGLASGYGYGSPNSSNAGCFAEASTLPCNGLTHRLRSATGGGYYTAYKGAFGKLQIGVQYSYTERQGFSSNATVVNTTLGTVLAPAARAPVANEQVVMTSLRYFPF